MDDSVLAQFQSTFLVSGEVNDPYKAHPHHHSLYKFKKEGYGSQEARRHQFMAAQQSRRRDFADLARRIAEGGEVSEESGGEMEEGEAVDEVDGNSSEAMPQVGNPIGRDEEVLSTRDKLGINGSFCIERLLH